MKIIVHLAIVSLLVGSWTGCGRNKSSSSTRSDPKSGTAKNGDVVLAWNRKTLAEAYQTVGNQNPAWDAAAEKALEAFAQSRAGATGPDIYKAAHDGAAAAVAAGCDDPLIAYLHARFVPSQTEVEPQAFAARVSDIAERLNLSDYPPMRRFYACLRAAEASVVTIGPDNKLPKRLANLRYAATTNLLTALADMTTPVSEIHEAVHEWLPTARNSTAQFPEDMKFMEPALKKWPEVPLILLARAECSIDHAWNARGWGYANSVTPQNAKLFEDRLKDAQTLLEKAWKADPTEPRIATKMLSVAVGLSFPRAEMEKWFERAMKFDTNNYAAAEAKLHYLKPQWYGSAEEMTQFGRACVASSVWGGRVPLILYDAHLAVAVFLPKDRQDEYWKDSVVWEDVQSSFERFFALNPDGVGFRHNYALQAFRAGHWDIFNKQLPLFTGGTNYQYFGGKERFEAMVAEARQRGGK